MKMTGKIRSLLSGAIMGTTLAAAASAQQPTAHHWAIVVHGGAGIIERASMKPTIEASYRASLTQATEAGAAVLDREAPRLMQSKPRFAFSKMTRCSTPGAARISPPTARTSWTRPSWTARI